jgi:hypothetical protein
MRNETTYHEVGGFVIEVTPVANRLLMASTVENSTHISIGVDEDGKVTGATSVAGVRDEDQLKPMHRASPQAMAAMEEAIRQRRAGEVVPEDLAPDWLEE